MAKHLKKMLTRLLVDDDGPTAVEYCVMLAAILLACMGTIATLGGVPGGLFSNADNSIRSAINN